MGIFNLEQFPNVCRMCVQPKSLEELIPIETCTLEQGNQTLLELLNDLTFEAPKDVSTLLPTTMCASCFAVFEFVVHYQQKMSLLLKFLIALAKLKLGSATPMMDLFSADCSSLTHLIKELNLCNKEEVQLHDFLADFGMKENNVEVKTESEQTLIVAKSDDVEFYNIEYIEEDVELTSTPHEEPQEAIESLTEFLEDTDNEAEEFKVEETEISSKSEDQSRKLKPKTRMLQCHYCKYRTTSNEMFQNHINRHESPDDENPWKCSFANCNEVYRTNDELLKHKKEIHSKYVCDICGMVLKHKYTLEIHLRRHKGESKYPCQYCATSYFTSNELKLHMTVVHLNVTDFQCNDCGLAFKNKKSLTLHEKTHSEQRSFQCDECNNAFKTSAHLRRHHNNVHRAIKFSCTMCPINYGRKDKLRMHMEKSHNVQTYFPCDICLKSFSTAGDLSEHTMHHKNPKELECATCLSAFFNAKEFDDHLCIAYREDYVCCDRDFKYHLQYNKHMFLAHGLKTNVRVKPASNQLLGAVRASRKPVERCTKCEQVFATRKQKKDHMAICEAQLNVGEDLVFLQQHHRHEFPEDSVMAEVNETNAIPYHNMDHAQHLVVKMQ